jgi:RNA polymerase sigma-70 factor (ECF subfamily)
MATSAHAFAPDTEFDTITADATHTDIHAPRQTDRLPRRAPARPAERPDPAAVARVFGTAQLEDMRRMAVRLAGAGIDPDDLLHDALERALASFDRFEPGTNLHAWMRTIMFRLVVDRSRSRRRRKARMEIERWAAPRATPAADQLEPAPLWAELDIEDVRAATATLSAPLQLTFQLFAIEGLSYEEVAERLGIPAQTVGTRLLRAKLKLRTVLAEQASRPAPRLLASLSRATHPVPTCRPSAQLAA